MNYLFDTNVWVAIQRGDEKIRSRWEKQSPDSIFPCSTVVAELLAGALKSEKSRENLRFVDEIIGQHDCLNFGVAKARRFAELGQQMRPAGHGVKIMDLQIASVAAVHGLRIVTHDVNDFGQIPGIEFDDWQA